MFEERYKKLNDEQKKAVDTLDGPVFVMAGPGSGKTELLGVRVANILKNKDVDPENILCVTFTESAKQNMRARLATMIGDSAYRVHIHTFHGLCSFIMHEYPEYFYEGFRFRAIEEVEKKQIFKNIFESLPGDNPLANFSEFHGFVFLDDTEGQISRLRHAAVSVNDFKNLIRQNEEFLTKANALLEDLPQRISKDSIEFFTGLADEVETLIGEPYKQYFHIGEILLSEIKAAIESFYELDSTRPLSAFKSKFIEKSNGAFAFKDSARIEKMKALGDVYEEYLIELEKRGVYDFDSMILDVLEKLEENDTLLQLVRERFHYFLIDEFQDTSPGQLKLIHLISEDPIDNSPNILAVGDEDQAIYSFQGADSSNIGRFLGQYPNAVRVNLFKNYRSHQGILDLAESVISTCNERQDKNPLKSGRDHDHVQIDNLLFQSEEDQFLQIAEKVRGLLDAAEDPHEIAVISKKNGVLRRVAETFLNENIPVHFDKDTNIFDIPEILEIIDCLKLIKAWNGDDSRLVDELLSKVLKQRHFEIPGFVINSLSIKARSEKKNWKSTILSGDNNKLKKVVYLFDELAKNSEYAPAEVLIDAIIGNRKVELHSDEKPFKSRMKKLYYEEAAEDERLEFLTSLQAFIGALRSYKDGVFVHLNDALNFIDTVEQNGIIIRNTHPLKTADKAVQLVTAHKAKGQEYKHVFVVNSSDGEWYGRGRHSILPLPKNIPSRISSDAEEVTRLFFVAITRAKTHLYICRYKVADNGSETEPLKFFTSTEEEYIEPKNILEMNLGPAWQVLQVEDRDLIRGAVENYKLNATHLNTFLNVYRRGPEDFIERHIFRFPQAKNTKAEYGSIIHECLRVLYEDELSKDDLLSFYEQKMYSANLTKTDKEAFLVKGREELSNYFDSTYQEETSKESEIKTEIKKDIFVDDVPVTGEIDKLIKFADSAKIVDYKTGRPFSAFESKDIKKAVQMLGYKRQLLFYIILADLDLSVETELQFIEGVDSEKGVKKAKLVYTTEDVERTKKLIKAVYSCVKRCVFPDPDLYESSIEGIIQFEDDLIAGKYEE